MAFRSQRRTPEDTYTTSDQQDIPEQEDYENVDCTAAQQRRKNKPTGKKLAPPEQEEYVNIAETDRHSNSNNRNFTSPAQQEEYVNFTEADRNSNPLWKTNNREERKEPSQEGYISMSGAQKKDKNSNKLTTGKSKRRDVVEDPQQEEYELVEHRSSSQPTVLPRSPKRKEPLYQNSQSDKSGKPVVKPKHSKQKPEPRYIKGPAPDTDTQELYMNERDTKEFPQFQTKSDDIEKPLPQKQPSYGIKLPGNTSHKRLRTRHFCLLATALIIVLLGVAFLAGWFGRGGSATEVTADIPDTPIVCGPDSTPLSSELTKCAQNGYELVLETETGTNLSKTHKQPLYDSMNKGTPIRVAYQDYSQNGQIIWTYTDAYQVRNTNTGDRCVQLHQSVVNSDVLINSSLSLAYKWHFICTNGWVNKVTYAVGTGTFVRSNSYQSPTKWFVLKKNPEVVHNSSSTSNVNTTEVLGEHLSNGHDFSLLISSNGYLSSDFILYLRNDTIAYQTRHLSINPCVEKLCPFRNPNDYIVIDQIATSTSSSNWNIMRFLVETHTSSGYADTTITQSFTWFLHQCWEPVHTTDTNSVQNNDTKSQLINVITSGHKVRVSIRYSNSSVVAFETSVLIVKDNDVYALSERKVRPLSSNQAKLDSKGYWEWTIVSTTGKITQLHCSIGGLSTTCNKLQKNFLSITWATDTNGWSSVYQKTFPHPLSSCGSLDDLIGRVKAGKPVRYMVESLKENVKYIHQTDRVQLHQETGEVVIDHFNEVLLQWNSTQQFTFASPTTLVWRQLSTTGSLLQNLWLYGGSNPVLSTRYHYIDRGSYNITWFAQS